MNDTPSTLDSALYFDATPESLAEEMNRRLARARSELRVIKNDMSDVTDRSFEIFAQSIETVLEPLYTLQSYVRLLDIQDFGTFQLVYKKVKNELVQFEKELFSDRDLVPANIRGMQMKDLLDLYVQPKHQESVNFKQLDINLAVLKKLEAHGALLSEREWRLKHKKLERNHKQLLELCDKYWENLNEGVKRQGVLITGAAMLDGLPQEWKDAYERQAEAAEERLKQDTKGKSEWRYLKSNLEQAKVDNGKAWLIIPERREVEYLLTVAKNPEFRRKVLEAYHRVGVTAPYDNRLVVTNMRKIRHEIAILLGYNNYADYITTGENIRIGVGSNSPLIPMERMLGKVLDAARPRFEKIKAYAKEKTEAGGKTVEFSEADYSYWMNRYANEETGYDAEAVSDYLTVDKVLEGISRITKKTNDIILREDRNAKKRYDDEIVCDLVKIGVDETGKQYEKYTLPTQICFDLFQRRGGKRPLPWASYVPGRGHVITQFEKNVENPRQTRITVHEAQAFFHEFGHTFYACVKDKDLHAFEARMETIEEPSTWMEYNLFFHFNEVLRHYKTDQEPDAETLKAAKAYGEVFLSRQTMRYAVNAWRDMICHSSPRGAVDWPRKYCEDSELLSYGYPYSLSRFGHMAFTIPPTPGRYYNYLLGAIKAQLTVLNPGQDPTAFPLLQEIFLNNDPNPSGSWQCRIPLPKDSESQTL